MKGWWTMLRSLQRARKGAVLLETAFAVVVMMTFVIGVGVVAVQGHDLENRGRVAREAADYTSLYLQEVGALDAQGQEGLEGVVSSRLGVGPSGFRVAVIHVLRNTETGAYEAQDVWEVGSYDEARTTTLVSSPLPRPGVHAQGEVLTLDLGEEVLVVESIVRSTGVPKGTQAASPRRTWAVVRLP